MQEHLAPVTEPPLTHLSIIMDGNGRWAEQQGLPRVAGHHQGVQAVTRIVDDCVRRGISYLSLLAFSSENWGRPQQEVAALMELLLQFLASQRQRMLKGGIRLRVIGNRERLGSSVCAALAEAEEATSAGSCLTLVLALSYGGRDEIVRAARQIILQVQQGTLDPAGLNNDQFGNFLDTADIPDPDLLIRTSGEMRISNFLLWQSAYTELYFTDVLWPDFDSAELQLALDDYHQRKRRFGLTDAQLGKASASADKE